MLRCIESTALETEALIRKVINLMQEYKEKMREILRKGYSHELLNNLFSYPYTKIEYVMAVADITRVTATTYLNKMVEVGLLQKVKKTPFVLLPQYSTDTAPN
jgi:filamentation induced by cAMP protein fic